MLHSKCSGKPITAITILIIMKISPSTYTKQSLLLHLLLSSYSTAIYCTYIKFKIIMVLGTIKSSYNQPLQHKYIFHFRDCVCIINTDTMNDTLIRTDVMSDTHSSALVWWMTQTEHWCGNTFISTDDADTASENRALALPKLLIISEDFVVPSHCEIFKPYKGAAAISLEHI